MKKCCSCYRYIENWQDAKTKGLKPRYYGLGAYYYKPRKGIKPHTLGFYCPNDDEIRPDYPACNIHEYRWVANFKIWYTWHFKWAIKDWYREKIKVPLGGLRKPIALKWKDSFCGMTDMIIPFGEPVCPRCGEMPYSLDQCVFCGQRFIDEAEVVEVNA